jgi:hypothetical protein
MSETVAETGLEDASTAATLHAPNARILEHWSSPTWPWVHRPPQRRLGVLVLDGIDSRDALWPAGLSCAESAGA